MNVIGNFYKYTGIICLTHVDFCGMSRYEYYRYRKWHPLLWVVVIIALLVRLFQDLIVRIKSLPEELNEEIDIEVSNTIKK